MNKIHAESKQNQSQWLHTLRMGQWNRKHFFSLLLTLLMLFGTRGRQTVVSVCMFLFPCFHFRFHFQFHFLFVLPDQ